MGALILWGAAPAPRTATFAWVDYRGDDALPPGVTQGPSDYRNPILAGFYPDPSITRAGDAYYLVNSTFSYFPGLPVFKSTDLIHWTQIGNAIDRPSMVDFGKLGVSRGLFAPAITYHDGLFWIVNTCVDCGGNFVITARDPAGPWSDPVWLKDAAGGIDPSLFFDDDGSAWLVNNDVPAKPPRYDGHRAIWLQRFDPVTKKLIGARRVIVDGGTDPAANPIWIEGPHLFRKDGHYYLIAAEGGTAENHSQVVFRADAVTGPYVPFAGNPILTQRDLPADRGFPITSTGHAGFVDTGKGWWATFLGVRPYDGRNFNTGRETFLLPVTWTDGWPRITAPGAAVPYVHARPDLPASEASVPTTGAMTLRQNFAAPTLPLDWMMLRNPAKTWYRLGDGATLEARPVGLGDRGNPSFLARRQQHLNASITTQVRFSPEQDGDRAGLAAFQNDDYWLFLGIEQVAGKAMIRLDRRADEEDPAMGVMVAAAPLEGTAGAPIELRITARGGRYDFAYATRPGAWRILARDVDGTILSTQIAGGFVGTMLGIYAYGAD
ncbi:glycoside hydrolase family 43 protein [Hephaestia sp. GCM10023244]|uniref:glycoside hydrolase family 43 protein n=1 Tax=unclassified Hephaestia TaxID=2631281 RepID=UPI002076EAED|nr:glycoside hydrolase family 43 protein [Hephaestia sp. MAHUQ-44]MCM8730612.1 glycoside hydrolase family 43 protein [Hephaestia sp. MAHUQ-44]